MAICILPVQNQVGVGGIKLTVMRFRDFDFGEFFYTPNLEFSFTVIDHDFFFEREIFGQFLRNVFNPVRFANSRILLPATFLPDATC